MKVLILLSLATLAFASIYELPVVNTVVLKHVDDDHHYDAIPSVVVSPKHSDHHYDAIPSVVVSSKHSDHHYDAIPSVVVSPKESYHGLHLQSLSNHHPSLLGLHYPVKKYTVHYPSGLYHGPHGLGIYNPKLHDELEQAYYRG